MGALEDLTGQRLTAEDIAAQGAELIKNIADPLARTLAEESQRMFGETFVGIQQTSQMQIDSTGQLIQSQDRLIAVMTAIEAKLPATAITGALAGGGPAAQVAIGSAILDGFK